MTAECRSYTIVDSPIGRLLLIADGDSLTGLQMEPHEEIAENDPRWKRGSAVLDETAEQLTAYFAGALPSFDLPIKFQGTPFQERVWEALRAIPFGETISYAELARRVGSPGSARAVGAAVGRNPVAVILPCHRVVGSNGSLTGFGGGLDRKRWLLEHEGFLPAQTDSALAAGTRR